MEVCSFLSCVMDISGLPTSELHQGHHFLFQARFGKPIAWRFPRSRRYTVGSFLDRMGAAAPPLRTKFYLGCLSRSGRFRPATRQLLYGAALGHVSCV